MDDTFQIGFLVSFLPLFLRIIQCIRIAYDRKAGHQKKLDVVNVFKFVTSGFVTILSLLVGKLKSAKNPFSNTVFELWIAMATISTMYSYTWDIKMGWSLCQKGYGLLRKEMYYSKWTYYSAIILNFIFRITWILNISPDVINSVFIRPELSAFALGFAEMIRRTIWNFLRVDKEAVFNKNSFGFIQDITISLNEISAKSSNEKNRKTLGKISLDSHSSFSVDDLIKREHMSSLEDLGSMIPREKIRWKEEIDEEWELVEEKVKKDVKLGREEVEEMKKDILKFEKQIREKSKKNTLIGVESLKKHTC